MNGCPYHAANSLASSNASSQSLLDLALAFEVLSKKTFPVTSLSEEIQYTRDWTAHRNAHSHQRFILKNNEMAKPPEKMSPGAAVLGEIHGVYRGISGLLGDLLDTGALNSTAKEGMKEFRISLLKYRGAVDKTKDATHPPDFRKIPEEEKKQLDAAALAALNKIEAGMAQMEQVPIKTTPGAIQVPNKDGLCFYLWCQKQAYSVLADKNASQMLSFSDLNHSWG
jgi:hypothetical protein